MDGSVDGFELVVARDRVAEARVRERRWQVGEGEVLVAVERFATTTNNVTYAVLGERLRYWQAWPTGDDDVGVVPAWGFARVLASTVDGVGTGERLWGFWPTATHGLLRPGRVDPYGLVDATPHRDGLAGTYQRYERTAVDPFHDDATAHLEPLYRPLFATAFLLEDQLLDAESMGVPVRAVVVTSASSKTATALAWLLSRHDDLDVVGVTSAGAVDHVRADGVVDRVVAYDRVGSLAVDGPAVLVDVAGRADVTAAIHARLGDGLVASLVVGLTHHDAGPASSPATGPERSTFFAPGRAAKRVADWGPAGLAERIVGAWRPFAAWVDGRTQVRELVGLDALESTWPSLVAGEVEPGVGLLVTPTGGGS